MEDRTIANFIKVAVVSTPPWMYYQYINFIQFDELIHQNVMLDLQ